MFKLGALALALGSAALASAETISVEGQAVEVVRMSCSSGRPAGDTFDECLEGATFVGCSDPADLCMKKNFRFASCRPSSRGIPSSWDSPRIILCDGSTPPPSSDPPADPVEDPVDEIEDDKEDEIEDVKEDVIEDDAHETKDRDPEEGTNCLQSDLYDTVTGEQKCLCAGRLWRCADKADPITKACDVGFECIRKNKHYAICAAPDGDRARKVRETCEWDMTVLPCGVHVSEYRTDKLLARGVCPP